MNIFVGNLSFSATEADVKVLFEAFGLVSSVSIKKKSGKNSRGFGFVVMPDDLQAEAALAALEGKDFMGRPLSVSIQRPKPVKPKKNYKEIKRLKMEAKNAPVVVEELPTIPEKKPERKPSKKIELAEKRFTQPAGAQAWEKRKGRGTAKPWKKKPGGVNKKFRHAK
jgi:RNA recognition motif-containing protein